MIIRGRTTTVRTNVVPKGLSFFFTIITTLGLLSAAPIAMAGQSTACPTALLGAGGNICTASDISIATAIVGQDSVGEYCMPGDTIDVNINGSITMRKNSRWDVGIFVASDGKDIKTLAANGGAQVCEVVPLPTTPRQRDGAAIGEAPVIGSFDTVGGADQCGDVEGLNNGDVVSNIPLTVDGGTFNGPVTLACVAGPNGKLRLQSLVSWNQTDPGACDPTNSASYDLTQTSKCSANTTEIDIDIVGRLSIEKVAENGGLNNFSFSYTNDSVPPNANVTNPSSPFVLQDGDSDEIFAEIGTGPATIVLSESNLPNGWSLANISCEGDDATPVVVSDTQITVTLSYNANNPAASQSDITCTYTNVQAQPELTLDKTTSTASYDDTSDTISYSYNVLNSGNVGLAFPVTVSDNKVTVTCPANDGGAPNNGDAILDPGESIDCSATYNISQSDINAGSVTNIATASADGTQSNQDTVTVNAVQNPLLTVVKTSPTNSISTPGAVSYSYLVTNAGNISLTGINLVDDNIDGTVSCPGTSLEPNGFMTCTATHTVTQGEINDGGSPVADSGFLVNNVDATSNEAPLAEDALSIPIVQNTSLAVLKTGVWNDDGSTGGVAEDGETISYTIRVTNDGNTTQNNITVTDPLITDPPNNGSIVCPGGNPFATLAPAAFVDCTATYSITQGDVDNGSRANTATATSDDSQQSDDETVTLPGTASLSILKTGAFQDDATADGFAEAGETINYTFRVSNDGNVTLNNVAVTDPLITDPPNSGSITCPGGNPIPSIAGGAFVDCTASYTLTQTDVDAGQVDNTATADSDETEPTTDDETVPLVQNPSVVILKTGTFQDDVDSDGLAQPGETISYTFRVDNDGFVTLTNVAVTDPKVATITCPGGNPIPSIAPGAFVECTGSYTVQQADIDAGQVENTGTADPDETPPEPDDEITQLPQRATMTVVKSSATTVITAPGTVLYSYLVTNTGNVTLNGISLTDDNDEDDLSCPATTLAPQGQMTCSASHTVTQGEIDANGSPTPDSGLLFNVVTADADEIDGSEQDDLSIPIQQNPAMTVQKSSPTDEVTGEETITYNYLVTNTGNVTLNNISLSDDNDEDDMSCPSTSLAPNTDMVCSATHVVTADELNDNGSPVADSGVIYNEVTASSDEAEDATDELSIPIRFVQTAKFRVTKDFSDDNPDTVEVFISCNTGLPLDQSKVISEGDDVNFVVTSFDRGELDCHITEVPVPAGYTETYTAGAVDDAVAGAIENDAEGCHFLDVEGGQFTCEIYNELDAVDIIVNKEWIGEFEGNAISQEAEAYYTCWNVRTSPTGSTTSDGGSLSFYGNSSDTIDGIYPDFDGSSYCSVNEVNVDSAVEPDDSDCQNLVVTPGVGSSCTIYNVLFYEGIPTLNQYGLLLLALLTLGVGAVGFRRFV